MRRLARWWVFIGLSWAGIAAAQTASSVYNIDPAASQIHWLVYKAGALARLGHNHAIAVSGLTGSVTLNAQDLAASRFDLAFPVGALVVDDPTLRGTLGEEFTSVPSADDIAGTRRNMLSDRVLDGEKFALIRVTGTGPVEVGGAQTLNLKIELLGRTIDLTVPTEVNVDGERLESSGEFELQHTDLGMRPFSVMMGALQVSEKLSFSYHVVALAAR